VLADEKRTVCYLLGPVLLTGHNVGAADAALDKTTTEWVVNLHFDTDDFVQKVASVEVGKQVAIAFRGVVESAPTVNPGITGRDVTISGTFDETEARRLAAEIDPSSASTVSTAVPTASTAPSG
jgi:preprotein translocase subunit SecD